MKMDRDQSQAPRQFSVSERVVELPEVTTRDSNNVERTWRRWKALHLVSNPRTLSKLLERRVDEAARRAASRVCLICNEAVPAAHQPYGWLEKRYGNGLLCGRAPCLEAALRMAQPIE